MQRTATVLALAATLCCANARADDRSSTLGFGLMTGLAQARDDTLVPIRWLGPELGISASFRHDAPGYGIDSRLRFAFALLFDPHATLGLGAYPGLWVAGRFPVANTGWGPLRLGVEAGLHEDLFSFMDWDDDHLYWLAVTALGPSAELSIRTSPRRTLDLTLGFALLALVSRSPLYRTSKADDMVDVGFWLGRAFDEPKFATLNKLQSVSLRATHRAHVNAFHLDPWAELEFDAYSDPERVTVLNLWLGGEARFGL